MRESNEIAEKMHGITAVVVDADGCLTRGWLGDGPPCAARSDRLGLELAQAAGLTVVLLSDQDETYRDALATAIGSPVRACGPDRLDALLACLDECEVSAQLAAYLGSDLPDLPAMYAAGLSVSPRDGALLVRKQAHVILETPSGRGALRELVERLLLTQGRQCEALRAFYAARGVGQPGDWLARLEAREADRPSGKIGFRR